MRSAVWTTIASAALTCVQALTLDDVCTPSYVSAHLPSDGFYESITINSVSVTANPVTNVSVSDQTFYPDAVFDYCNVTFTYSHVGLNDTVLLTYWLPDPNKFQNRYLSTGGGGYAINSDDESLPGGIIYGAVAGKTDGGFGIFQHNAISTFLVTNGTMDWQNIFMFGYQAIHELGVVGKAFTKTFFNMTEEAKLYSYYQGCSEGGREGWSQVQRFGDEFDGAAIGAPAFRFAFQQVQHLYSNVVEQTENYYPPPCELQKIFNETLLACDALDGRTDGVVSRTDLCSFNYDIDAVIGLNYYCAPAAASAYAAATPEQNGTVSAEGVAVAKKILDGLHDTDGKRVYFSYTTSSSFNDATTVWNETSQEWELSITSLGGSFPEVLLNLQNGSNLPSLDGVTYDTLRDWIYEGWNRYSDTLMTNWPDLTPFKKAGGKVIHFHGESDDSIPTASSVRYFESVRQVMYPGQSYNESVEALNDWYRLFLVPGGAHCSANSAEPNGPWPQTTLAVLIDWVENGDEPVTLNGTVLQGENKGETQQICSWPLRPYWSGNGTEMECQYDQKSIDSWHYDLDAFFMPVY
ncbi:Tannase/feruloyl esterase [Pseudomassariella vexata]|uniref:Carboxylic ester hydrolase n=1 Tax=Pseudomassariella vexata TaxID=1141098 RepID=A0A1Y2E642_9PEZI|nr:Tannase/feruloyl esterase [Pseudomassariella vexata]ORY67033.1 Tannase/feruloyl esterase [Pseudomassariella vexata]